MELPIAANGYSIVRLPDHAGLEHDPEKWISVFGKDHAQTNSWTGMAMHLKAIPL
jgi:hypothetical protein